MEMELEHWYKNVGRGRKLRLSILNCSICGRRKVVFIEEGVDEIHRTSWIARRFIVGGRTPNGYLACDVCLEAGARIDEVKQLENRLKELKAELRELREKALNLAAYLRDFEVD